MKKLNLFRHKAASIILFLGLFTFLFNGVLVAQDDTSDLYIFGVVKDFKTRKKLEGCIVKVFANGSKVESFTTNKNGKFEFFLPLDKVYKVEFTKTGYVSKHLRVNVKNIPDEDRRAGFSMGPMDASLFQPVEGIDYSLLDDPIGKIRYYPERGAVEWDAEYTSNMLNQLHKLESEQTKKEKTEDKEEDKEAKELEKKQAEFDKYVADGDASMGKDDFKTGIAKYQAALKLFSDNAEVKGKLENAQGKLDEKNKLAEADKNYNTLIDKGDDNFQAKNYEEAISKYQEALGLKSGEKYPTDQIKAAEDQLVKIRELKAKEEEITQLMADAGKSIADNNFDQGISKYEQVLNIDGQHSDAKTKLEAAKKSKKEYEDLAKSREEYEATIKSADSAFQSEDYEKALAEYNNASSLMPKETYPIDRAKESQSKLDGILAEEEKAKKMAEIQGQFDKLVSDADEMVGNENYDQAISKYDEALNLLEEKNQSVEDKKQAAIDARDKQRADAKAGEEYDAAIAQADELLKSEKYQEAIDVYKEAIGIKDEQYPKDKISEAESALKEFADAAKAAADAEEERKAEEAKKLERQRLYDQYIEEGNRLSNEKDYGKAIENYNNALGVLEGDKEAKNKLAQAEKDLETQRADMADAERLRLEEEERLAALATEEETEAKFNDLVANGDEQLAANSYLTAIEKYEEALTIKDDKKVSKKIKEARKALEEDEQAREEAERLAEEERLRQEALDAERAKMDEEARLEAERLAEEERLRQEAMDSERAKMDEEARLEAERLAEEARKRQEARDAEAAIKDAETSERNKYLGLIKDGDASLAGKEYSDALDDFKNALSMRPDEKYPASKIEKLEILIAQEEKDRRKAEEREARRKEREEQLTYSRGADLGSSEEERIDNEIANERRLRDEARWKKMQDYKDKLKEKENSYKNLDNEQLAVNQDELQAIKDAELKRKEEADARHQDLSSNMKGYKEGLQSGNERISERADNNRAKNQEEQKKLKTYTQDYVNSDAYKEMTERNNELVENTKAFNTKMATQGKEKTETTQKEMEKLKNKYQTQQEQLTKKELDKISKSSKITEKIKENIEELNSKGISQQVQSAEEIAARAEIYREQEEARANKAKDDREQYFEETEDIITHRGAKDPMSYGKSNLADDYPQGVTEETSTEGKTSIIRRIVVVGNKATEYKKVTSVSGTFYFKNGQSTSKYVWDIESRQVLD